MQNGFRTDQLQKLQLRVDPRLVLSGQLLGMSSLEVRTAIETELVENPALDWLDSDGEPMYLETILKTVNPGELKPGSEDREFHRSQPNDASETDWTDLTGSIHTLEESLEGQLGAVLDSKYAKVIQIVIHSIDDRGYLVTPAEEIAMDHGLDMDDVEFVINALKDCEPCGVGASNLQECLVIQLRRADTLEGKIAYNIAKYCFDELVDRNIRALARRFKVLPDVIQSALEVIRSCSPYPADQFERDSNIHISNQATSVPVDMKIVKDDFGWSVEIPGIDARDLIISHAYREHMLRIQNGAAAEADEKRHLSTYVNRAKGFIDALTQRAITLTKLGNYLIQNQSGFITTGEYRFLKSLTRRKVAADLGLHESTISRATAGKHIQLLNGEVVSFEVFFKPALRVQQMITEILAKEDPEHPFSDEKIAQMLSDRGVDVARRTVNKYRDRTKLLSSRHRKNA